MVDIDLGDMGNVSVGRRFTANLNISSSELFNKYPSLTGDLSKDAISAIKEAVDDGEAVKPKKIEEELIDFFTKISDMESSMGVGADELDELDDIEDAKREDMKDATYSYETDNGELTTIDRDTGEAEGKILLGEAGEEGKKVPIIISEKVEMYLNHDGSLSEEEGKETVTTGYLTIENNSTKDRLWDIDLALANTENVELESEEIEVAELPFGEKNEVVYGINIEGKQDIEIKEFISTLNDPETESYALVLGQENEIYFAITAKNLTGGEEEESEDSEEDSGASLSDVVITKLIPEGLAEIEVSNASSGEYEIGEVEGERAIIWKIESLDVNEEIKLEFSAKIVIDDKDVKARTGEIKVEYVSPKSISGLKVDKFDAYTNNRFYIGTYEMDEEPDNYECQFTFENRSEFFLRLVNADVYDINDPDTKYIDIDVGEVPPLPEGAKWQSNVWNYQAEEGVDPIFRKKIEFYVLADDVIQTVGALNLADVELAVAAISGSITYDVAQLPSFKESPFNATMRVENTGGAFFNDLTLQETVQTGFKPPKPEEIVVTRNGNELEISEDMIVVEGGDLEDSSVEHTIYVKLENLRDTDLEAFKPGDVIEVTYPIIADKPAKDTKYISNVLFTANTYPAGKPLEYVPYDDEVIIEVVHQRKRLIKGKEITALADAGNYEITLYVINTGKFPLENYEIMDKVPDNFEYSDMTMEPEVTDLEGEDILKWVAESIEPGDEFQIKYRISGEGKPSEAQETL